MKQKLHEPLTVDAKPEGVEQELADYLLKAINEDFLLVVLITSHTQAAVKSKNLPFGMGKTTLLMWLLYYLNGRSWERVFELLFYNPYDLFCALEPLKRLKEGRINAIGYDDIQATAPAEQGVPKAIRKLANYITTTRPEVSIVIGTADNITNISSPLRKIVLFEIIVADRGYYEVQKIIYHKDFDKPFRDKARLEYVDEGRFPKLPAHIEKRYKIWRAKQKAQLYPAIKKELAVYLKLQAFDSEELGKSGIVSINAVPCIKSGDRYLLRLPREVGEALHKRQNPLKVVIDTNP